jgi:hypothetical protein
MTVQTAAPGRTPYDEWRDRRWRLVGLLLGVMALVTAALMVTMGVRPASYGDLLSDVASSKVDEVQVIGFDDAQDGERVQVRWTVWAGLLDQYADVEVGGSRAYNAWDEATYTSADDPRDTLRSINADLTIRPGQPTSSFLFAGWEVPGWLALLATATWLGALLLLVGGPPPWRATRWAWAWACLLGGPLGAVAFLLLGGPLGVLQPRAGHRRLTGGWAFLVCVLFLPATWSAGM